MTLNIGQDLESLNTEILGDVVTEGDATYEVARLVWNRMFDRRPLALARCRCAADVKRVVEFARDHDLPTTIRGGGHAPDGAGLADGALAIDLSPMGSALVDADRRRVVVQGGAVFGPVDRDAQLHGLAFTGGTYSKTGVTGLTLGGGIGWTMRKYGATVDCVKGFDIVSADGTPMRVDSEHEPDLFWGMRGAGSNFGVVTSTEFALHPVGPTVLAGVVAYSEDDAPEAARVWRDFMDDAPREVTTMAAFNRVRPSPVLPPSTRGTMVLVLAVCYVGDLDEGERVLKPLREIATPLADIIAPMPYVKWQQYVDTTIPPNPRRYEKGGYLKAVDDETLDLAIENATLGPEPVEAKSGQGQFVMMRMGGAIDDVDDAAMAFSRKTAGYWWDAVATWTDPQEDDLFRNWSRESYRRVSPKAAGEAYVNLTVDGNPEFMKNAYGEDKYERLVALKDAWDPDNFFRFNKNIQPSRDVAVPA